MRYYNTKWAAYKNRQPGETAVQDGSKWVVLTPAEHEAYRRNLNQKRGGTAAGDRKQAGKEAKDKARRGGGEE